jgi:hypothetical protein
MHGCSDTHVLLAAPTATTAALSTHRAARAALEWHQPTRSTAPLPSSFRGVLAEPFQDAAERQSAAKPCPITAGAEG